MVAIYQDDPEVSLRHPNFLGHLKYSGRRGIIADSIFKTTDPKGSD